MKFVFVVVAAALLFLFAPPLNAQEGVTESQQTDWFLCAHGSTRSRARTDNAEWTVRTPTGDFHIPYWQVPFSEGPDLAGGVNQRVDDGHIHLPLLGADKYNGSPDEPSGGSLKRWSPALVWEIDANTGKTVHIYNLSDYADCFNSVLRYSSDGYPIVAGYTRQGSPLLVLDKNGSDVVSHYSPGSVEPQLLQVSTTNPPQLLWADLDADGAVNLNGHELDTTTELSTSAISAIICGADGRSIYNNGFFNHNQGIYRFELPLTSNSKSSLFISGCLTKPWVMAVDSHRCIFAFCQSSSHVNAWDKNGHMLWSVERSCVWLSLSDDEKVVLLGDGNNWEALDTKTGKTLWQTSASEAFGDGVKCSYSAQPWAPRHPIAFDDGSLAFLCSHDGASKVMVLSIRTGKAMHASADFDFAPEMLTADASYNVYAYGSVDGQVAMQKKSLKMKA